jgi:hypothetical protein
VLKTFSAGAGGTTVHLGNARGGTGLAEVRNSRPESRTPPYLNAWFSRLFWRAMVSTSGPPSAMNLANFSARFLASSSSGGETLSRLSVLSSTHHTQQPNFC